MLGWTGERWRITEPCTSAEERSPDPMQVLPADAGEFSSLVLITLCLEIGTPFDLHIPREESMDQFQALCR